MFMQERLSVEPNWSSVEQILREELCLTAIHADTLPNFIVHVPRERFVLSGGQDIREAVRAFIDALPFWTLQSDDGWGKS